MGNPILGERPCSECGLASPLRQFKKTKHGRGGGYYVHCGKRKDYDGCGTQRFQSAGAIARIKRCTKINWYAEGVTDGSKDDYFYSQSSGAVDVPAAGGDVDSVADDLLYDDYEPVADNDTAGGAAANAAVVVADDGVVGVVESEPASGNDDTEEPVKAVSDSEEGEEASEEYDEPCGVMVF